jgi:uncharacterized membrane protein YqiK
MANRDVIDPFEGSKFDRRMKRIVITAGAGIVVLIIILLMTFTSVGEKEAGIITITLGDDMPAGKIIATNGEKGIQAGVLGPGYHFFYWPWKYDIKKVPVVKIPENSVGIINAIDGKVLPRGQTFAPEWSEEEFDKMLDSQHFLTKGSGYKGPQTSVLPPGEYRLNTDHFRIKIVPATNIQVGEVGVIKSNVGKESKMGTLTVPDRTYRGIVAAPLSRGMYYLNTEAFEINKISVKKETLKFNPQTMGRLDGGQITVRSQDGFEAPIDVDVTYQIEEENAPEVVARFVDNKGLEGRLVIPSIRAEFRNAAGNVPMLNFILQRQQQEQLVLKNLSERLLQHKVKIHEVYIRDIDFSKDPQLAALLKTQTDRQIAKEQMDTYISQQKAAEEEKVLNRKDQEAEEEKKVVIAEQKIKIAEQEADAAEKKADGEARAIERTAQAEAKKIELIAVAEASKEIKVGEARAQAYAKLVKELGQENIALLEFLKEIASGNIKVVPDVSVSGGSGNLLDALMGNYLKQQTGKK